MGLYARILPYEAEIWRRDFRWRGPASQLEEQLVRLGEREVLCPSTAGVRLPARLAGAVVRPVPLRLDHLPEAARLTGVAGLLRSAPPFCEGDLLAERVDVRRAALLLLGPETVGWALDGGRLRDAFRSADEEAIGGCTSGAVESRWAVGRLVEDGAGFARCLFGASGLQAMPAEEGLAAWRHRLRMALGRLAAALGRPPDAIYLGGEDALVDEAERTLGDLGPVVKTRVAWGLAAWAEQREG